VLRRHARLGVEAHPLQHVGPVQGGRRNLDDDLLRSRLGVGHVGDPQDLGAALLGEDDRSHACIIAAVTSRFVPLQGASNFRDLGGLPIASGGTTHWRSVFRSDTLQDLSDNDVKIVRGDIGITTVIDLRTSREIMNEGRGPLEAESLTYVHLPFIADLEVQDEVPDAVERDVLADYVHMLDSAGHLIAEAVHTIAVVDGPVVFHCAAGKDRTGILAALVLSLAGVSDDVIVGDYALTNQVIRQICERLARFDSYTNVRSNPWTHFRCRPEVMEGFLELLDERHGGAEGWARAAGLDDADLGSLRSRLGGQESR
jgi:protein tyrosine/serine phosphatase